MNFFSLLNNAVMFLSSYTPFPTIVGGATEAPAGDIAGDLSSAVPVDAATSGGGDLFSVIMPILMWGSVAIILFFFMYRQPKKEMKKKQELRASIKVGDSIMTNAGLFGKVVEIGTDSFVVEFGTNRGVRVPILKDAVEGVREPRLEPPAAESN